MTRNNADFQNGQGNPQVGLVPISTLEKYKEFDREGKDSVMSPEYLDELTSDIKRNGFEEPLQLTHENGIGSLSEGNHRLIAAKRLGMTHVPVIVYNRGSIPEGKGTTLTWVGGENKHGYIPSIAHPSNYKELR